VRTQACVRLKGVEDDRPVVKCNELAPIVYPEPAIAKDNTRPRTRIIQPND